METQRKTNSLAAASLVLAAAGGLLVICAATGSSWTPGSLDVLELFVLLRGVFGIAALITGVTALNQINRSKSGGFNDPYGMGLDFLLALLGCLGGVLLVILLIFSILLYAFD